MQKRNTGGGAEGTALPPDRALRARTNRLKELSIAELKQAWFEAWGTMPPSGARRRLLMLGIAWRWQAVFYGGHARAVERRLAKLEAGVRLGNATIEENAPPPPRPQLMPGTRLLRIWKKERHEVHVTERGYLWRGTTYRSLSVIAREITGSRRNGPAFFGLRKEGGA